MNDDPFDGELLDLIVPEALEAQRVDRALALLTGRSRAEVQAVIAAGAVEVDGRVVTRGARPLRAGERVRATFAALASRGVDAEPAVEVTVVLEAPDFLVVDKAAGVVVHPGAGQRTGTLVAGLLARYPELNTLVDEGRCEPERPGVVHRLDRGTSGLLVVARSASGLSSLREQVAARSVERRYLALVEGHVEAERGVIDAPIGRSARSPTLMAVRADGRSARTHYRVLSRVPVPKTTLLELRLETGRTHQIRVHLASIAHPVVNDPRYGRRRDVRLDEGRPFLHAAHLGFNDPASGERVEVDAPLPADLAAIVREPTDP